MGRLVIESGPLRGKVIPLPPGKSLSVGRDTGCVVQIPDARASRLHCILTPAGKSYVVQDRQSANGTFLNGHRVDEGRLKSGDMLRTGETFFSFFDEAEDPLVGKVVAGYRIDQRLGRGGMGTVYRASQVSLNRTVALKILSRDLSLDEDFVKRFSEEAHSAGKLNHPNVVQIHDAGMQGEHLYLSMEFMAGGSLQELIEREGVIAYDRLLPMMQDALKALVWARQHNIVHRDIKPDNLLLDLDGRVKIGDFGIAADTRKSKTLYEGGKVIGTPLYMSPEQALGKAVDHRADLYSLGATMYFALSATHPFTGDTPVEILLKKVKESPHPLEDAAPDVPAPIVTFVHRMLERQPSKRFESATQVYRTIASLLTAKKEDAKGAERPSVTVQGTPRSTTSIETAPHRRQLLYAGAGVAIVLVLLGALALAFWLEGGNVDDGPSGKSRPPPTVVEGAAPPGAKEGASPPEQEDPIVSPRGSESTPSSENPGGQPPETEPSPKPEVDLPTDVEIRTELLAIRDAALEGRISAEKGLELLARFTERHPDEKWRTATENVRRRIESSGAFTRELEEAELEMRLTEEVRPLVEQDRYAEALDLLQSIAPNHPKARALLEAEGKRVESKAHEALATARLEAEKTLQAEGVEKAALLLEAWRDRLPPALQSTLTDAVNGLRDDSKIREEALEALAKARIAFDAALVALDFAAAEAAVGSTPKEYPAEVRAEFEALSREVRLFKDTFERIRTQLLLYAGEEYRQIAVLAPELNPAPRPRRVLEVSGLSVKLQTRGSNIRMFPIASLSDETLLSALTAEPSGAAVTSNLAGEEVEGVAVFLLHVDGAARAWRFLQASEIEETRLSTHRRRLTQKLSVKLEADLQTALKRLDELWHRGRAERSMNWDTELATLRELVEDANLLPVSKQLRADLGATYVEGQRLAILARAVDSFFHASKVELKSKGVVQLTYDFREEEQLEDFFPVGESNSRRLERRGLAVFRGQYRFLRGEPFRNQLSVAAVVPKLSPVAPNVNWAFWTQEGEAVPAKITDVIDADSLGPRPVVAFCMGYQGESSSTINGLPYVTTANRRELTMPANFMLVSPARNNSTAAYGEFHAQWGQRAQRGYRAPASLAVGLARGKGVRWTAGGERLAPGELPLRADSPGQWRGSVTLFTVNSLVTFSSLVVEGELEPAWLHHEASRQALTALSALDRQYPYEDLALPLERTVRGNRWGSLEPGEVLFADNFEGRVREEWKILREEKSSYSLDRLPGALTITTQGGGFSGSQRNYENLFLVDSPAGDDQDFSVTARIVDFHPTTAYQQAGIICFDSEDDYIKADIEFSRSRRKLVLLRETRGRNTYTQGTVDQDRTTTWLRLSKRGNVYTLYSSSDGDVFERVDSQVWGNGKPARVGLFAKNSGMKETPGVDASFDLFEVRALSDDKEAQE